MTDLNENLPDRIAQRAKTGARINADQIEFAADDPTRMASNAALAPRTIGLTGGRGFAGSPWTTVAGSNTR